MRGAPCPTRHKPRRVTARRGRWFVGDEVRMLLTAGSGRWHEPVGFEPGVFGFQGFAAKPEGTEQGAADRPEIGPPAALLVGFDMAGTDNPDRADRGQIDRFGVDGSGVAGRIDDEVLRRVQRELDLEEAMLDR